MVNGIINGFMKVSGQNYLEHSSYVLSKFFFEELKKLSPPKLHHIWGQRRHQKLRLAFIFNMTIQLFVEFKNRGARAKLKILKLTLFLSDFRLKLWIGLSFHRLIFASSSFKLVYGDFLPTLFGLVWFGIQFSVEWYRNREPISC